MTVTISKINIISRHFDETLAFYRRLGLDIPDVYGVPTETRHAPATNSAADFAIDNARWRGSIMPHGARLPQRPVC